MRLDKSRVEQLAAQLAVQQAASVTLTYHLPDGNSVTPPLNIRPVRAIAALGDNPTGTLVYERRQFRSPGGSTCDVSCPSIVLVKEVDTPMLFHGSTGVICGIIAGSGFLISGYLGEEQISEIQQGAVVEPITGQPYGFWSPQGEPMSILVQYTPGLAPVDAPEMRDVGFCGYSAGERILELRGT